LTAPRALRLKKSFQFIFSLQANKLDIIFFLKTANLSH